jgi:hypothetical protein
MTRKIERKGNNGRVQKAVPQQIHFYKEKKKDIQKGLLSWHIAIPLCKVGLDYFCSMSTMKNEFLSLQKKTLFS